MTDADDPAPRSATAPAVALAIAWAASTLTLPLHWRGVRTSVGFVLAAVGLGAALILWPPRAAVAAVRQQRGAWQAAAVLLAAHVATSVAGARGAASVLAQSGRLALVLLFGVAFLAAAAEDPTARRCAARAGAAVIAANAALWLAGRLAWPLVGSRVYLTAAHQHLAGAARYVGLSSHPLSAGCWMLLAVGLARAGLPPGPGRRAATVAGVGLAAATLSVATLAALVALAAVAVRRPALRWSLVALGLAASCAVLHTHVLEVRVGARVCYASALHPGYARGGLGARAMPVQTAALGAVAVRYHATAYHLLARAAVRCFAARPLTGVGAGGFERACAVTTMNTYGAWSSRRTPHNQFTAVLAEHGLLGLAAAVAALALVARRYRLRRPGADGVGRWSAGILAGALVCGLGGEMLETLPFAAWLALQLEPRDRGCGAGRHCDPRVARG